MTAGTCSATVTVVGIGTFTCEEGDHVGYHSANLPSDETNTDWATITWTGDAATIAPPGSRRGRS